MVSIERNDIARSEGIAVKAHEFQWDRHPDAEFFMLDQLQAMKAINPEIARVNAMLHETTNTRLLDWLDHITLHASDQVSSDLRTLGFDIEGEISGCSIWGHPDALLPRIHLDNAGKTAIGGVAMRVERIADYLMVHGISRRVDGSPGSSYRRCLVQDAPGADFWIVERRSHRVAIPETLSEHEQLSYLNAVDRWKSRPRHGQSDQLVQQSLELAGTLVSELGPDRAAHAVFEAERAYWQSRNAAGQFQKARQDRIGAGWANHDHHTFRSSRRHFTTLIRIFETLGFNRRERYHAGAEAGWGAQVMENRTAGFTLFLDVDLDPHEIDLDFKSADLDDKPTLGTVGLWCELHGESLLEAGLHHVAAHVVFDEALAHFNQRGVGVMPPFSTFSYLTQAFTKGERWSVTESRLDRLLADNRIDIAQAEKFRLDGAVGSHLELIQRREGFKGFNQHTVSLIIRDTDPRKQQ